jgi:hypothetical protein
MPEENVAPNETPTPEVKKEGASTTAARGKTAATKTGSQEKSLALSAKRSNSTLVYPEHTLPGNRPVEASHLKIVRSYRSGGTDRPVIAGDFKIDHSITVSGKRPIAVSTLKVSETYSVMGSRPVASNEIDNPPGLMGFID